MARLDSKCKLCRREGEKLMLKGARCLSSKCAFTRRSYAPGVHGPGKPPRITDYGKQLREKQKAKRIYGLSETQFSNYYEKSLKMKGDSGVNLVNLLENRLDNVVFRAGFAKSRAGARQQVGHSNFLVNGKKVNIPSYSVKIGDVITLQERKKTNQPWKALNEELKNKEGLSWLNIDVGALLIKITGAPTAEELKQAFDPKLIIEYYSR